MNEADAVLSLFDTAEKWNAYVELARMKEGLVAALKSRLYNEMGAVFKSSGIEDAWMLECAERGPALYPKDVWDVSVCIEWGGWNASCYRRSAFVWINANAVDGVKAFSLLKEHRGKLPLSAFDENFSNNPWLPYVRTIPAEVFEVEDSVTAVEECLYMAIHEPKRLARNL